MEGTGSRGRMVKAAGVAGVVALALTGCVDLDAEDSDAEDSGAEQEAVEPDEDVTTEDTEDSEDSEDDATTEDPAEEFTEESTEEHGDPTETDTAEAEDGSGDAEDEVPEWSAVTADMWSTMESADSVDLSMTMPFSGRQHTEEEFRQDLDIEAGDDISQRIYGAFDGPAIFEEQAGSQETTYLLQDELILVAGEDDLAASADALREQGIDPEDFEDDLAGKYVDYSEVVQTDISIGMFMTDVRSLVSGVGTGLEAERGTRDGEDVWVYTDGSDELVVRAGDEPVLLEFTVSFDGGTAEGTLTDWDSAEVPEEVDEDDILSLDEAVDIYSR